MAGRHHARQGALRTLATLQQPVRKITPLAQLGDGHTNSASAGIEIPMPRAGYPYTTSLDALYPDNEAPLPAQDAQGGLHLLLVVLGTDLGTEQG